jgi:hypothetical protein
MRDIQREEQTDRQTQTQRKRERESSLPDTQELQVAPMQTVDPQHP